ncbi:hypothetical protein PQQ51_08560 [Paraburkholderia xenovorans]|uniref:hypothetical protein n=1 Tax=Paraburkholderia xenovorans TaxID=36873 RepID=UPI0038B7C239
MSSLDRKAMSAANCPTPEIEDLSGFKKTTESGSLHLHNIQVSETKVKDPTVLLRSASAEDSAIIANLHTSSWQSAYRVLLLAEYLDEKSCVGIRPAYIQASPGRPRRCFAKYWESRLTSTSNDLFPRRRPTTVKRYSSTQPLDEDSEWDEQSIAKCTQSGFTEAFNA